VPRSPRRSVKRRLSKEVCDLFTKGSRQRNISVILITRNLFHQGRYCRDTSLKAKYQVLLKNARDRSQFIFLAHQVYPEYSPGLTRLTRKRPNDPIVILIYIWNRIRMMASVFEPMYSNQYIPIYSEAPIMNVPIDGEASEIELSRPSRTQDGRTETV